MKEKETITVKLFLLSLLREQLHQVSLNIFTLLQCEVYNLKWRLSTHSLKMAWIKGVRGGGKVENNNNTWITIEIERRVEIIDERV